VYGLITPANKKKKRKETGKEKKRRKSGVSTNSIPCIKKYVNNKIVQHLLTKMFTQRSNPHER